MNLHLPAMTYIYLASPYSHKDKAVMDDRYNAACRAAASIIAKTRRAVFAPIAHSHPIADWMPLESRVDFEMWMLVDLPILRYAAELWVLRLDGWAESRGVTREREYARSLGIPTFMAEPEHWL
jgi:hypothetical protein